MIVPPFVLRVIPLLGCNVKPLVTCKAPPLKVIELAVTVPGIAPKFLSSLI